MGKLIYTLLFGGLLVLSCKTDICQSVSLIPSGFQGIVIIVYDQPNGTNEYIEDGKHVYRIPSSGILYTKVNANPFEAQHEYYYIDNGIITSDIRYLTSDGIQEVLKSNPSDSIVYVYGETMGSTAINKENYRKFRSFIISTIDKADSLLLVRDRLNF